MSGPLGSQQWMYASEEGYQIDYSANFAGGRFTRNNPGNRLTWTFSTWLKFNSLPAGDAVLTGYQDLSSNNQQSRITCHSDGTFSFIDFSTAYGSGGNRFKSWVISSLAFTAGTWHHLVVTIDTTNATATERTRFYVDGVKDTGATHTRDFPLNWGACFYNATELGICAMPPDFGIPSAQVLLADTHFVDGVSLSADSGSFPFGEFVGGTWKPVEGASYSHGSTGYFLKYANSGALGTDSSTSSNDWGVVQTVTQSTDTPTS